MATHSMCDGSDPSFSFGLCRLFGSCHQAVKNGERTAQKPRKIGESRLTSFALLTIGGAHMQVFDGRVMNGGERGKIRAANLRRHVLLPKALHDPAIDLILAIGAKQSGTYFHKQ